MRPRGRGAVERALRRSFDKLRMNGRGWSEPRFGADGEPSPDSAFDVQMRERVRGLEEGLKEVKSRVNGLIFLIGGVVVAQVVLRFVG